MKEKIAVLVGGPSGEHEISLVTGRAVSEALERLGAQVFWFCFGRNGGAHTPEGDGTIAEALDSLTRWRPDAAFIGMHGAFGEDGRVQGLLDMLGITYQGSDLAASAVAMDKARAKDVFRAVGLPVSDDRLLMPGDEVDAHDIVSDLALPLVLKTAESGSSIGIEVVQTAEALNTRALALLPTTESLLIEKWIPGTELTCPVLETLQGVPEALPVVEIRPHGRLFFDYESKYDPTAVDELCPAPIAPELEAEIRALSLKAHRALRCTHYSRTDIRLDAQGRPLIMETNTLPGLTPASLLPKSATAAGLSFDALVERLVRLALNRRP